METLKIGIIIPDRGDRPEFLKNCLRMINQQTMQPSMIQLVNDYPITDKCDITWRYRIGYDRLRNCGLDCILLMENDDWYAPDYIETMVNQWLASGMPEIIGTNYTIYYHIAINKHFTMNHQRRSSAMNTLLKPDLNFNWCVDHEPYTDLHLWKTLKGHTFCPPKVISIGIKHGVGLCGGRNHTCSFHRYINDDSDNSFLIEHMDTESLLFYTKKHDTPNS